MKLNGAGRSTTDSSSEDDEVKSDVLASDRKAAVPTISVHSPTQRSWESSLLPPFALRVGKRD